MDTIALLLSLLLGAPAVAQDSTWRQYATPEEAGFSSERLHAAWEDADRIHSAAVFAVYRGHALLAWGEVERRFECHSVRKSLMSSLVGRAVHEGKLDPEASLEQLGIDDREPLTAAEKKARLIDLLGARSGVYHPAAKEPADMRTERPARGSHAPGESFFYNNWDFNLPGTLLERATGKDVGTLFERWIAAPLGMEDFRRRDVCAELEPSRSLFPAHAFRLSARDMARFGQLYLQRGQWNGQEVVPADWVAECTRPHTDLESGRGYGLLWWTYKAGSIPSCPTLNAFDMFAAVGTGGQLILVVPGAEFVGVHRGDTDHDRDVRGGDVWDLFERIFAARTGEPRPEPKLSALQVERFPDPGPPLPDHAPVAIDPAALAGLTGDYTLSRGPSLHVFVHEGRLFAHLSDGEESELYPLGDSHFYIWVVPYEVEFQRDASGRATTVRLTTPRGTMEGRRSGE